MKNIFFLLLVLVMMLPVANAQRGWTGEGTQVKPFLIENLQDLQDFRDSVNSGMHYEGTYFLQTADITLPATSWVPIGNGDRSGADPRNYGNSSGKYFAGSYNGDFHKIKNLYISGSAGTDYGYGLFGLISDGEVKNIILTDVDITTPGNEGTGAAVGMIFNGAVLDYVTVASGTINSAACGGVVGRIAKAGTISNCVNYANVNCTIGGGGITCSAYRGVASAPIRMHITNCTNYGAITNNSAPSTSNLAGIVGFTVGANVSCCVNYGAITGLGSGVGGIVGNANNGGLISCNHNYAKITSCTANAGEIEGVGGIVGWVKHSTGYEAYCRSIVEVCNNTNTGEVYAPNGMDVGGIVGCSYAAINMHDNTNAAPAIQGGLWVGGLVGYIIRDWNGTSPITWPNDVGPNYVKDNNSTTPLADITISSTSFFTGGTHWDSRSVSEGVAQIGSGRLEPQYLDITGNTTTTPALRGVGVATINGSDPIIDTVCPVNTSILLEAASTEPATSWKWYDGYTHPFSTLPATPVASDTSKYLTIDTLKASSNNNWTITATYDNGCTCQARAIVIVRDTATITGPANVVIDLPAGKIDTVLSAVTLGTASKPVGTQYDRYIIVKDRDDSYHYPVDTTKVLWSLVDVVSGCTVDTCTQLVVIKKAPCLGVTDIDGYTYSGVEVGPYCWTGENLRPKHYADATAIATYYYENDSLENIYGKLYTWYSAVNVTEGDDMAVPTTDAAGFVQGVCPDGWHIPNGVEMEYMISAYEASQLMSTFDWLPENGTDEYNFTLLPAGRYNAQGNLYEDLHVHAYLWTTESVTTTYEACVFGADCSQSGKIFTPGVMGFSVRCVLNY